MPATFVVTIMPTLNTTDATLIMVARTDSFWNMSEITPSTTGMKQPRPKPSIARVTRMPSHGSAAPRKVGTPPTNTRAVASRAHAR